MTALPLPGPTKAECPCGCGKFGKPIRTRREHVRGCPCVACRNGRNAQGGKARHRKFARLAGIRTAKHATSEEEAWRDPFRWEIKSGKQVDPIVTRFEAARAQSEATRPLGDPRPFAMGAVPSEGARPALVILTADVWRELIVPLLEAAL